MKTLRYTIRDPLGVHARPAGLLAKTARSTDSEVTITKNGASVSADRLLSLMGLGIKCGDEITVTVTGGDEDASLETMRVFLENNL